MAKARLSHSNEQRLMETVWRPDIANDPLKFVLVMYPWGETGVLEKQKGPRRWQVEVLRGIRDHIKKGAPAGEAVSRVLKLVVSSGRGVGKSALVSWLSHWMLSTRLGSTTIIMANSEPQLKSRTLPEVRKWIGLARNSHWFETHALSIRPAKWFADALANDMKIDAGYYYIEGQLWNEENPDRIAGVHNQSGVMLLLDEASGIPDVIWDVCNGFFTDQIENRFWMGFSNPRRNSGQFYECFHRDAPYWNTRTLDSRDVEGADLVLFQQLVDQYGDDSDTVRTEVKGQFPRTGSNQFIGLEMVQEAARRIPTKDPFAEVVVGVDVARFGDDSSVIFTRVGRDAQTIPYKEFKGVTTMEMANHVAAHIRRYKPDAVIIDGGGVGGGVVDRLRQMRFNVIEIGSGTKAYDKVKYANRRAEMWGRGRDFLHHGGCIPNDPDFHSELTATEYKFNPVGQLVMESKVEMKKRGYRSPNCFIAGTKVLTPTGEALIEDFNVGDEVVTPTGVRRVICTWEAETDTLATVRLTSGRELTGKGTHRVFTWDKGWVRLDALSLANKIESATTWRLTQWRVMGLLFTRGRSSGFKHQVGTLCQPGKMRMRDFYTVGFGQTIMARYLKASISAISTTMGEITTLPTWRWLTSQNTCGHTCVSDSSVTSTALRTRRFLSAYDPWRQRGTSQKKGELGTKNTESKRGHSGSKRSLPANTAEPDLTPTGQQQPSGVLGNALKQTLIGRGLNRVFALIAVMSSRLTSTALRPVALASVPTVREQQKVKVYNLTLDEDNVYYANGVLVENCADALLLTLAEEVPARDVFKQSRKQAPRFATTG